MVSPALWFWRNRTVANYPTTQCFKITEKVSFNIASEASYVYILSRQSQLKMLKFKNSNATFWVIFKQRVLTGFVRSLPSPHPLFPLHRHIHIHITVFQNHSKKSHFITSKWNIFFGFFDILKCILSLFGMKIITFETTSQCFKIIKKSLIL